MAQAKNQRARSKGEGANQGEEAIGAAIEEALGMAEPSVVELLEDLPREQAAALDAPSPVAAYEKELRDRLSSKLPEPKGQRRRTLEVAGIVLLVLGVVGGVAALRHGEREERRQQEAARFIAAAANGLARDTRNAYDASVEALGAALALAPDRGDAQAMLAQALATLSVVYGTSGTDEDRARALLVEAEGDHPAALEARWLLARGKTAGDGPSELRQVEEEILAAATAGASAPIQSLAGVILLDRGQSAEAIERFNAAMQGMPAHVPTLVRIGDYYRSRREYAEAGRYYDLALAMTEEHVGALLGAAESRLALRQGEKALAASLADLGRIRDDQRVPHSMIHRRYLVEASLHLALGNREAAQASLASMPRGLPPPALARQVVEAWLGAGAPERAAGMFEAFLGARESGAELREAWAVALLAKQEYRKVTSIHADPSDRDLLVLQGIAWFHLGNHAKAATTLRSATLEGKLPVEALVHLSWIEGREGRVARAKRSLERFAIGPRARPSGSLAFAELSRRTGDLRGAEAALDEALARNPHVADLHWELGNLRLEQGRIDAAAAAWTEAVELNRFHVQALHALASLHLGQGVLDEAQARWEALLDHQPQNVEALSGIALLQGLSGEREKAQRALEAAAQLGPTQAAPLWARGRLAAHAGDYREAARWLQQATRFAPGDAQLWWEIGEARLAAGDAAGAGPAYARAGVERRGWLLPKIGRARAYTWEGRGILAAKQLRGLLDELGRDGPAWMRAHAHAALGEALLAQGKGFATAAREEGERALAAFDLDLAHLVLARALDDLGDPSSAAPHHERVLEATPQLPAALSAWGNHLLLQGEEERAAQAFERYLERAPKGPDAREARRLLASLRR
jgi:tetratricopeptide (TPR) repeat protein